jgi:hypothetical protein
MSPTQDLFRPFEPSSILGLYPRSYLEEYSAPPMEQTFRDILKDNNAPALWFRVIRVIKELPYSLLQEYLDVIRKGGKWVLKKEITTRDLLFLLLDI